VVALEVGYPAGGISESLAQVTADEGIGAVDWFADLEPVAVDQIEDEVGEPWDELPLGLVVEVGWRLGAAGFGPSLPGRRSSMTSARKASWTALTITARCSRVSSSQTPMLRS
jgi:hypothetical protein